MVHFRNDHSAKTAPQQPTGLLQKRSQVPGMIVAKGHVLSFNGFLVFPEHSLSTYKTFFSSSLEPCLIFNFRMFFRDRVWLFYPLHP